MGFPECGSDLLHVWLVLLDYLYILNSLQQQWIALTHSGSSMLGYVQHESPAGHASAACTCPTCRHATKPLMPCMASGAAGG